MFWRRVYDKDKYKAKKKCCLLLHPISPLVTKVKSPLSLVCASTGNWVFDTVRR